MNSIYEAIMRFNGELDRVEKSIGYARDSIQNARVFSDLGSSISADENNIRVKWRGIEAIATARPVIDANKVMSAEYSFLIDFQEKKLNVGTFFLCHGSFWDGPVNSGEPIDLKDAQTLMLKVIGNIIKSELFRPASS